MLAGAAWAHHDFERCATLWCRERLARFFRLNKPILRAGLIATALLS